MFKLGKRGKMNIKARKMIADYCELYGIERCELKLDGCTGMAHAPAHRMKRRYYRTAEELADPKEWIPACQSCHDKIEKDPELTKQVFIKKLENL